MDSGRKKDSKRKRDIFEALEENIKLFTGIWIKENMLGLIKVEAIN